MNAAATLPQQVDAEEEPTSDFLYQRLENARSILQERKNGLSAAQDECDDALVQYLRSIVNVTNR
jgi:hypothetical protein